MANTKKYVSLDKLSLYNEKIKKVISDGDAAALASAKQYFEDNADRFDTAGSAATALTDAKAYADGKDTAIAAAQTAADNAATAAATADGKAVAAQTAADNAQTAVDELDAYVGDIPEGYTEETVIAYINKKAEETLNAASGGSTESAASVKAALDTEIARAKAAEEANATAASNAQAAADAAQEHSEGVAGDLATETSERKTADEAQVERIAALEDTITGLSGAMHFEGVVEVDPTTITEGYENGDTVIYGNKEYVWNNGAFVEFGDASVNAEAITALTSRVSTAEGKITTLEGKMTTVEGAVATKAEQTALDKAVEDLEAADSGLDTRLKVVEDAVGESGSVADDIATAKQEAIDTAAADATSKANTAESNAKTYADGLNTAMDARVGVVEAKAHEHSNKALLDTYTQTEADLADAVAKKHEHSNLSVLEGITTAKVTAWDAAEGNAKTYADGLNTAMDTRVATLESWHNNFTEVSEEEINALFTA